jgi:regulator of sigma E protease
LALPELNVVRETDNPLTALGWGVTETRDLILQFYVTLKRMIGPDRSVSPTNLMGFIGIADAGARFAIKGPDWLIWFLAMISANLAVVNFLPIPVVDGGHFVFLLIEKLRGRPVPAAIQEFALKFGLVLLLGIFLFVTYNDIARIFAR